MHDFHLRIMHSFLVTEIRAIVNKIISPKKGSKDSILVIQGNIARIGICLGTEGRRAWHATVQVFPAPLIEEKTVLTNAR